jgi:hypothetical protein
MYATDSSSMTTGRVVVGLVTCVGIYVEEKGCQARQDDERIPTLGEICSSGLMQQKAQRYTNV